MDIGDGAIRGVNIEDGSLTGADIGDATLTGGDTQDGSVSFIDISQNAVRRSHLDGTEVGLYRFLSICGSTEFTLLYQCQTVLCSPGPPTLFFACNGTCSSTSIRSCDNTLVGYMISPASLY